MAVFNWAAVAVGVVLALHHVAAAGVVYLILFYATFVGTSLEESFEFIRLISRAIGRCAKFAGIAATRARHRRRPRRSRPGRSRTGGSSSGGCSSPTATARPLFEGLDLRIEPGEHVGLVGPSGSGKTTLTKLLLRFVDRDGGLIEIDGQDIAVRHAAVVAPPHRVRPPGSRRCCTAPSPRTSCYGHGPRRTGSTWTWCAPSAVAPTSTSSCDASPTGYETVVGERGMKLSGGQRQRVAIAQAMAKGAKVLVLDEATSALDSESESLVQEALWHLMEGTTALVVAHRLATIARLDRIVVLDRGRVVEQGTHAELLSAGRAGVYGRLWAHQSGGFLRRVSAGQPARARRGRRSRLRRADSRHVRGAQREEHPECRRPTRRVDDVDEALVRLRDRLGDGQAETGPGHAHLGRRGEPVEALEELVALADRDSRSLVEHLHPGEGVDAVDDHVDPAAAGRELDGV